MNTTGQEQQVVCHRFRQHALRKVRPRGEGAGIGEFDRQHQAPAPHFGDGGMAPRTLAE